MKQITQTRIIWAILVVVVFVPLLVPLGLPKGTSPEGDSAYNTIDRLPAGSVAIMDLAIAPSNEGELWPMALAIAEHHMSKGHKIITVTFVPDGVMYAQRIREVAEQQRGYKYGADILVLPYRAGGESALAAMAENIRQCYQQDQYGSPLSQYPLWQKVQKIEDVSLVSCYTASDDHLWLARYVWAQHKVPCIGGVIAISAPEAIVYWKNGQLVGLISGVKGAAIYEQKIGKPGAATASMDAQSMGHMYLLLLIILGNIIYWSKKKPVQAAAEGGKA